LPNHGKTAWLEINGAGVKLSVNRYKGAKPWF